MTATRTRALELARSAGIEHHIHAYESPPRRGRERDDRPGYGLDAATALHAAPARVFKTLVAEVDDRIVLAQRASGYVIGGISPLGTRRPLRVVIDPSALAFDTVFISAGRRGLQLELAGADLIRLADATVPVIARPRAVLPVAPSRTGLPAATMRP